MDIIMVCIINVPQNLMYWRLGPQFRVFRGGDFGRWLDPEGSDFINGTINPLMSSQLNEFWRRGFVVKVSSFLASWIVWGMHHWSTMDSTPWYSASSCAQKQPNQWPWAEIVKLWVTINLSSFKLISKTFCHRDRKLTNSTPVWDLDPIDSELRTISFHHQNIYRQLNLDWGGWQGRTPETEKFSQASGKSPDS
jgi:hypothetical protein